MYVLRPWLIISKLDASYHSYPRLWDRCLNWMGLWHWVFWGETACVPYMGGINLRCLKRQNVSEPAGFPVITVYSSIAKPPSFCIHTTQTGLNFSVYLALIYGSLTRFWPVILKQKCGNETLLKILHLCYLPLFHPFLFPVV